MRRDVSAPRSSPRSPSRRAALADATVQAVDGTLPTAATTAGRRADVTVKVGETVTWTFAGTTRPHNVAVRRARTGRSTSAANVAGPAGLRTRSTTPGTYKFVCGLHARRCAARSTVTDETGAPPPPPPPPPLSEQPFANDTPALAVFEVRDSRRAEARPRDRHAASHAARSVPLPPVRGRQASTVRLTRGAGRSRRRTVEVAKGTASITVRGLRAGSYRVEVTRQGPRGQRGRRAKRARVTVR